MEGSKRKKIRSALTNDFWCLIIHYLSDRDDFINLIIAVKFLQEYIQSICPTKCENILFKLKTFPVKKKNLRYCCKIEIGSREGIDNYPIFLQNLGCKNLEELFEKVYQNFSNLLRLRVNILQDFNTQANNLSQPGMFKLEDSKTFSPYVRNLEIHFSECNFRVEKEFRMLESLTLINCGLLNSPDTNYDNLEKLLRRKNKLVVSWDNLPNLRTLRIHGWRVLDIKHNIEVLEISCCASKNSIIEEFPQLRILKLSGFVIKQTEEIRNLPNLEVLELSNSFYGVITSSIPFFNSSVCEIQFVVKNFPKLVEFSVSDEFNKIVTKFKNKIVFGNVPNLRRILLPEGCEKQYVYEK